jgi:hypothetical protein
MLEHSRCAHSSTRFKYVRCCASVGALQHDTDFYPYISVGLASVINALAGTRVRCNRWTNFATVLNAWHSYYYISLPSIIALGAKTELNEGLRV